MTNKLNTDRLSKVLSEILSEKYSCKVTITFIPKEPVQKKKKEDYKCI